MYLKIKQVGLILVQTAALVGITIFAILPVSCKITPEGIQVVSSNYSCPVLKTVTINDSRHLSLEFNKPVLISGAVVSERIKGISDSNVHSENKDLSPALKNASGEYGFIEASVEQFDDGKIQVFNFTEETTIGKEYQLFGVVEDETGNSLSFSIPFEGYNSRIPKIIMTEIQIHYQKSETKKYGLEYRSEFIEFVALSDGNLSGLKVYSVSDGESKGYVFPPVEVHKGEVFLVHFRNSGEKCISETGNDLNLATERFSCTDIRDLWSENESACFNGSNDIIIIENRITGDILDCLMYADPATEEWKSNFLPYIERIKKSGVCYVEIENAANSKGASPLKSIQRKNAKGIVDRFNNSQAETISVVNCREDWQVGEATNGKL